MPFRSRLALLSSLTALALACAPPPSGVHVIVTLPDADFDEKSLFDHLTVTAVAGKGSARACLFASDAVERERQIDDPSPFACADSRTQPWNGPPTAQSWALESQPRRINVEAKDGEEVEVTVVGGLGGRLGTVRGQGTLAASPTFPELVVTLAPDLQVFPAGCEARLEPAVPEAFDTKYRLCDAGLANCPEAEPLLRRSPAISCLDDGSTSRVRNGPGFTCKVQSGQPTVWRTPALPTFFACARIFVTGHFVRCKNGNPLDPAGCVETTECTPQATAFWVRAKTPMEPLFSSVPMECIPPVAVPITWSVRLDLPKEPAVFGLSQSVSTAYDGACFLDVQAIASTAKECVP